MQIAQRLTRSWRSLVRATLQVMFAILLSLVAVDLAFGQRAMPPDHLTIGYDEEGKIDASPKACLAVVKEITQWDEAATQQGAQEVCAARKAHVDAYAALQTSYKAFIQEVMKDRRYDWAGAAATTVTLVKTCMDHKFSITTGGHNIRIDIINNEIATACLALATNLMRDETRQLTPH
jgi:hypothetical protein